MEKMFNLLLEYYDGNVDAMKADYKVVGGYKMASGGSFAIYYGDQKEELKMAGYNVGKLTDNEIFEKYCNTVSDTLDKYLI